MLLCLRFSLCVSVSLCLCVSVRAPLAVLDHSLVAAATPNRSTPLTPTR